MGYKQPNHGKLMKCVFENVIVRNISSFRNTRMFTTDDIWSVVFIELLNSWSLHNL